MLNCVKAQNNLHLYTPICKDFLYYECHNSFLFPKASLRDDTGTVVPKSKWINENPFVCLLSGNATICTNQEIFTVIPHSLEDVILLCNEDTIRLEVFHLTYREAELLVCSKRNFLPNLKTKYNFYSIGIEEKYKAFQEIAFYADSLKAKIQRDTVFIRFRMTLANESYPCCYIDSITINLKNSQGFSLKKTTIKVINNVVNLQDILDYQQDIKVGNSLEIICSRVFSFEYTNGHTKEIPIYQYYIYKDKPSNYNDEWYTNGFLCYNIGWDYGWGDDFWGQEMKDYGIPAVFRIKFY